MGVLLEEELWSYVRVTIGFLVTSLTKALPPIAQFGKAASSRKSLGGSKLLPFKNDWGHCVLGDLQCYRIICWYPSPDLCLDTIPSPSSKDNSFDLMAWFLLWHALSTVEPYIDRCVPFQTFSNQLNLPQVDSNQDLETSQGWSMETGCTWVQFRVSYCGKGSENICKSGVSVFALSLWGIVCRLMRGKNSWIHFRTRL